MTPQPKRLSQGEFIAMLAMLFATVAFSIDSMLPALPRIAEDITPDAPNRAQLIVTSFVLGMGIGTFFTGPISDALGRKPVVIGGAALYCLGALLAWASPNLEMILVGRIIQGLGAAGPRVVAMAIVRDLYSGREMARITSFIMVVFTLVPALAPLLGQGIIWVGGWRAVFAAFILFAMLSTGWLVLRQPETLPPEARRPVRLNALWAALKELAGLQVVRLSIAVQTLCYAMLFSLLSSIQQIFETTYGHGASFPLWFGAIAVVASTGSVLNARLVRRLGMRKMIKSAFVAQIGFSAAMIVVALVALPVQVEFAYFLIWAASVFFQLGLTIGNLNALAMEPVGHIAGTAASIISALATVLAVAIAIPIGLAYDGTPLPLALGISVCAVLALMVTGLIRRDSD